MTKVATMARRTGTSQDGAPASARAAIASLSAGDVGITTQHTPVTQCSTYASAGSAMWHNEEQSVWDQVQGCTPGGRNRDGAVARAKLVAATQAHDARLAWSGTIPPMLQQVQLPGTGWGRIARRIIYNYSGWQGYC
ncbi:MAG: hypothetical protein NVSMB65_02700 [Chloroflexota bacterium]